MADRKNQLTVKYDPPEKVRLSDLRKLCARLTACLDHIAETSLRADKAPDFTIAELSGGSIAVTIAPQKKHFDQGAQVIGRFKTITKQLQSGAENGEIDDETLALFRRLAGPVAHAGTKLWIDRLEITTQFIANIDKRLEHSVRAFGTMKGRLDRINVHGTSEFHIYPPIRMKGIRCTFPDELTDRVGAAVRKHVIVTGQMLYYPNEPFPRLIHVESISDPIPPDGELPTLSSLRGIAPNCTGDLSTLDYLGAIANE